MSAKTQTQPADFAPLGDFGVQFAHTGEEIIFRIPASTAGARRSSSGKMDLNASTGGWVNIPGTPLRVNLTAGARAS